MTRFKCTGGLLIANRLEASVAVFNSDQWSDLKVLSPLPLALPDVDATVPLTSSVFRRAPDDRRGVSFQVLLHPV
jgi:hypothetical protein